MAYDKIKAEAIGSNDAGNTHRQMRIVAGGDALLEDAFDFFSYLIVPTTDTNYPLFAADIAYRIIDMYQWCDAGTIDDIGLSIGDGAGGDIGTLTSITGIDTEDASDADASPTTAGTVRTASGLFELAAGKPLVLEIGTVTTAVQLWVRGRLSRGT